VDPIPESYRDRPVVEEAVGFAPQPVLLRRKIACLLNNHQGAIAAAPEATPASSAS
jgi:hypothetical protein